jgi:hypothetical protein
LPCQSLQPPKKTIKKKKKQKTHRQGIAFLIFFFKDNKRHFKSQQGVRLESLLGELVTTTLDGIHNLSSGFPETDRSWIVGKVVISHF